MPEPIQNLSAFASTFRALSSRAQLTQAELADIAGVSPSAIGSWQRGESSPGVAELARLCRHFHVSADYMIGLSDFPAGLAPDSWIIDLDQVDRPDPKKPWAVKVPRRVRIVDYDEMQRIESEAETKRCKGKGKGKGSDQAGGGHGTT